MVHLPLAGLSRRLHDWSYSEWLSLPSGELPRQAAWLLRFLNRSLEVAQSSRGASVTLVEIQKQLRPTSAPAFAASRHMLSMNRMWGPKDRVPSLDGSLADRVVRAAGMHARHAAVVRIGAATLAVQMHRAQHEGRRPETLEAMVPDFLNAVPIDPFADPPAALQLRDGSIRSVDPLSPELPLIYGM